MSSGTKVGVGDEPLDVGVLEALGSTLDAKLTLIEELGADVSERPVSNEVGTDVAEVLASDEVGTDVAEKLASNELESDAENALEARNSVKTKVADSISSLT